jgi:hypothetical protein
VRTVSEIQKSSRESREAVEVEVVIQSDFSSSSLRRIPDGMIDQRLL